MSAKPYRIIDRRSSSGYVGGGNRLYQGAVQSTDRKYIPRVDRDTVRNVSAMGRRTMMNISRWLFSNFPAIEGAILEQSNLSVSSCIPQYYGRNPKWGDAAEKWLLNWFEIMNIAGGQHDSETYLDLLIISTLRDGDVATLLTGTDEGYPLIQMIPSHRIGNPTGEAIVTGGPYDGGRNCDGAIVDPYGRVIAYRVMADDGVYGETEYTDISTKDMFLSLDLKWSDQVRGFPAMASGSYDSQDFLDSRVFELMAQKIAASIYLVEHNESGEVDSAKGIIQAEATYDATGKKTADAIETISPGIRYVKANMGNKFETIRSDRPSQDSREFQESVIRDAFRGMEWDYFFSVKPGDVGGASMRVVVEKIKRVVKKRRKTARKAMKRICGYGISKAIKLGILDDDIDWWMWDFSWPADVTADRKYDSDVDLQEYRSGFIPLKTVCGRRGEYWEDVQDQKIKERKRLEERCKAEGIDPNNVQMLTPNGNPPTEETPAQQKDNQEKVDAE